MIKNFDEMSALCQRPVTYLRASTPGTSQGSGVPSATGARLRARTLSLAGSEPTP